MCALLALLIDYYHTMILFDSEFTPSYRSGKSVTGGLRALQFILQQELERNRQRQAAALQEPYALEAPEPPQEVQPFEEQSNVLAGVPAEQLPFREDETRLPELVPGNGEVRGMGRAMNYVVYRN